MLASAGPSRVRVFTPCIQQHIMRSGRLIQAIMMRHLLPQSGIYALPADKLCLLGFSRCHRACTFSSLTSRLASLTHISIRIAMSQSPSDVTDVIL